MTATDDQLNEYAKRTLAPLRPTPPMDPQTASEIKKNYLLQAETLRQATIQLPGGSKRQTRHGLLWHIQHKPLVKFSFAIFLAVIVLLVGTSITVSAAQDSYPGQMLYPLKSWSEDIGLAITASPQARLNLTLNYTNRRMNEISHLLAVGKALDEKTSDRFQQELDDALQLAAQLNDTQFQNALVDIRDHAESQGMTIQQLITKLPPQAEPAVQHLQERLNEQIQLSTIGEKDPKAFRQQVRERQLQRQENKHSAGTEEPESILPGSDGTPVPSQDENNTNTNQATEVPGHGGQGNGQDQSSPGNGNHRQNPTHTPKP